MLSTHNTDSRSQTTMKAATYNGVKEFFPSLFPPTTSNFLLARFLDFMLPDAPYVTTLHIKVLGWHIVDVKWPLVSVLCIAGIVLFVDGGRKLFRLNGSKHQFKGSFSWSMAMFWYAVMCFGGFWYHTINHKRFFHKVDVVGTGCSSLSIAAATFGLDDRIPANRRMLVLLYLLVTAIAFFSGSQPATELLYLLPSGIAFVGGLVYCKKTYAAELGGERKGEKERRKRKEEVGWWLLVAGFGGLSDLAGLVLSRWITAVAGHDFSPVFWFFFGCNVALYALFRVAVASNDVGSQVFR